MLHPAPTALLEHPDWAPVAAPAERTAASEASEDRTAGPATRLSLEPRTNFDGATAADIFPVRIKRLRYPASGLAEMVITRHRGPGKGHRRPVEHVDEDGVVTSPPAPLKALKEPWEVVLARTKAAGRARTGIRRAIMAGNLDHMVTLTFRANLTDSRQAWRHFTRFIRAMRDKLGEFSYVAVAERQKRGALHFHVAVQGWQDLRLIRDCWKRAGADGNIDVRPFKGPVNKMASYMAKYISKSFTDEELEGRSDHRYRRSHGLDAETDVQFAMMDRRQAQEVFVHYFQQDGLIGCASVWGGDPAKFSYYVWGCNWDDDTEPDGPIKSN